MEKKQEKPTILSESNTPNEELSAYERWELPIVEDEFGRLEPDTPFNSKNARHRRRSAANSPDDSQDVEDVKPLTAEELEAIRQAAYEEGKEEGKKAGYKEGYDQGYKSGESDLKAAVNKLAQISRALLDPLAKQDDEVEQALLTLLENICSRVVYRELKIDSTCILTVVKEAVACLIPGSDRVRIHLNPGDADFVIKALRENGEFNDNWRFLAHQTISPGGCIVDTDTAVVDARAEKRLATVIKQVYDKDQKALEELQHQEGGIDQLMGEVSAFQDDDVQDDDNEPAADESGGEP